ncbi:hypothetical protein NE857_04580 [Nocardiopsis exhalans]|uniref:DUF4232 domain-containing protein n=1 Tax=Nocardiopsis exhalans TaxID=163604 RepID=A0ABY5DFL3_9ACTN|nr:hypothetical protein [Nocardiopsis exhalans]USY23147.1 hypothetical protein NE857_04580 [Nocardiopsis exhalans]
MLVFALVALAFRNTGDEAEPAGSSEASVDTPEASPSVPADEPSGPETGEDDEEPSASPSPSPSADEDSADGADGEDGGNGSGGGSAEAPEPERPEDPCRPQDVVVTFDFAESDREVYGGGTSPEFKVTVVNTADQTCTVDVGPEAFELRIESGSDRVYSTADCVEGNAQEERQLKRGTPHDFTITWDLDRSFTDCRDSSARAQPGWYKANLHGDHVGSVDQLVFQLKA